MTDKELASATDAKLVDIWRRSGACRKDALYIMREMRTRKLLNTRYRFTRKALRIAGAEPGSWFCEMHGLNGRDIPTRAQREKGKPCNCPGLQEPTK